MLTIVRRVRWSRKSNVQSLSDSHCHFGYSVLTTSAASSYNAPYMDSHYIHHIDSLALTRAVVLRRNIFSRFRSHSANDWVSLHCRFRCFIQEPRVIWWYRWFTLVVVNNASYDFRSHGHFQVSEPANLANYELLHVRQSWLLDIQY